MALIFLQVITVFIVSSFEFHRVKLLWLQCQGWLAPYSPDLNPLITFGVNAAVLSQAANKAENSFW